MLKAGVLTISDKGSQGQRQDLSGPAASNFIAENLNIEVSKYEIVPDEREIISSRLKEWVDRDGLDLIVTSGGTGLSPRTTGSSQNSWRAAAKMWFALKNIPISCCGLMISWTD